MHPTLATNADSTPTGTFFAAERVRSILQYIGEDVNRDGLKETPERVVRSWKELYGGYALDPKSVFKTFDVPCDEMVIVKDIEFYSQCEHHMLPFFGKVHIGYLPKGKVIGLSKLARLVDIFARRLQVQERLGQEITQALMENLQPGGAGVVIEAKHLCMMARGVEKQNSSATTSSMRGSFREDEKARSEFLRMVIGK